MLTPTPISADPAAGHGPFETARLAAAQLTEALGRNDHRLAVWLGSGWQRAVDRLGVTATVSTADLAGFHRSGAMGHGSDVHSVRIETPDGIGVQA
ncbi:MAG: hypothetical protein WAR60_10440, partial [Candidatus Microthrix parvicella]